MAPAVVRLTERVLDTPPGRALERVLSRRYVLVTGCQRSGTTMTLLMLDAHPRIHGRDETEAHFRHPRLYHFAGDLWHRRLTCRKLPGRTHEPDEIRRRFSHVRVVWMLRHPLAVVSSMRRLRMEGWDGNWLERYGRHEMRRLLPLVPHLDEADVAAMDEVHLGGQLWAAKCRALEAFRTTGLRVHVVRYEDLLAHPEATMRDVLAFLGLDWDPRVLAYHAHRRNRGRALAGGTQGARPMDTARRTPPLALAPAERRSVVEVCHTWMRQHGYDEPTPDGAAAGGDVP